MRTLRQPGPVHPQRIDVVRGHVRALRYTLAPGATLNEAITAPLIEAGFQAATVTFAGALLAPFSFVMPGPPDGSAHVAYFTAAVSPPGETRVEQANITFGRASGKPLIHCHAAWTEADGHRRGGHILPAETRVAAPADVIAWGFTDVRIETAPDPETNFTLFQPHAVPAKADGAKADGAQPAILARVKPNEDLVTAIEAIAASSGIADATVRGSLGSLIGASFIDGRTLDDIATEVLVREGTVRDGKAELDLLVVDMQGDIHTGQPVRGQNPVCITFDVVLTAA
jgi:predicted DNA-binding protein with PD1-like motif